MNLHFKFDAREKNIFAVSDFHYSHTHFGSDVNGEISTPIWKLRGYSSCEEMDYDIIKSTNNLVKRDDILIYLGDLSLRTNIDQVESFLDRIDCQSIFYATGNHESQTSRIYQRELDKMGLPPGSVFYPLKYKNVIFCGPEFDVSVKYGQSKKEVLHLHCAHFPKSIFDKMKYDNYCAISGHTHLGFKDTHPETLDKGRVLDIGYDYMKRPWSFWEIKKVMEKKVYIQKDSHH